MRRTLTAVYTRFIPAGAGNSVAVLALGWWVAVYPRWRGELFRSLHWVL
ncbi:hypothetical protein J4199_001222 [Salmonella enterica]|nr:hypothetical protein [Salmonella enterica]